LQPLATQNLARTLMNAHGLSDWSFRFGSAVRQAGSCSYRKRTITLSKPLTSGWTEAAVRNVILHEIAHALVGPGHGHDRAWRGVARGIGCTGDRCWSESEDSPRVPPTWIGRCPKCPSTMGRYRRPSARYSCSKCSRGRFNEKYLIQWERAAAAKAA